jgi:predicted metal-dependent phosphoesterase TrpH
LIPGLAAAGLDGLEARHPEHDPATEARYRTLAGELGLAVTAGSDFHAEGGKQPAALGHFTMTKRELDALESRRR